MHCALRLFSLLECELVMLCALLRVGPLVEEFRRMRKPCRTAGERLARWLRNFTAIGRRRYYVYRGPGYEINTEEEVERRRLRSAVFTARRQDRMDRPRTPPVIPLLVGQEESLDTESDVVSVDVISFVLDEETAEAMESTDEEQIDPDSALEALEMMLQLQRDNLRAQQRVEGTRTYWASRLSNVEYHTDLRDQMIAELDSMLEHYVRRGVSFDRATFSI